MVRVDHLKKWFPLSVGFIASLFSRGRERFLRAVDGVSFTILDGEILGMAGESGCGKTTVGMTLIKLYEPTSGSISFDGKEVADLRGHELKQFRREVQIIFQNPYESLNPRFKILDSVIEPLHIYGIGTPLERREKGIQILEQVGLKPIRDYIDKFPHELSGGQRQRVAIARGIVLGPKLLVADEPVSMLDVSIRAGVLRLLKSINDSTGLSMLYISHDISTIRYICQRIAIMYLGRIVEIGKTDDVIEKPLHPYSKALIAAVPVPDPSFKRSPVNIKGWVSNPIELPQGCSFVPRCPEAMKICFQEIPVLSQTEAGHQVACHLCK
jgi:peptide/nickel transport system ATP-binding protein